VHTRTIDAHRFGPATTAASAAARNANFCHFVLLVAFSITFTCARNCHAPHGMMLAETPSMWQGAMHSGTYRYWFLQRQTGALQTLQLSSSCADGTRSSSNRLPDEQHTNEAH